MNALKCLLLRSPRRLPGNGMDKHFRKFHSTRLYIEFRKWIDFFNEFNPSTIALACTVDASTIFWNYFSLGWYFIKPPATLNTFNDPSVYPIIIRLVFFNDSLQLCLSPFIWSIFNDFLQRLSSTTFSNSSRLQHESTATSNDSFNGRFHQLLDQLGQQTPPFTPSTTLKILSEVSLQLGEGLLWCGLSSSTAWMTFST